MSMPGDPIRDAVSHVQAQSVRDRIELVIVAPDAARVVPDREILDGFLDWRVVEWETHDGVGEALAIGFRAARAPALVYVEEHSYPEPGWAEALIAAHARGWTAVGPAVMNANPGSRTSWASYLLDFGSYPPTRAPGTCALLPNHQTSYKRAPLLEYGSELGSLIETETVLQEDLLANGHELYFEPAARTRHMSVSRLSHFLVAEYHNCRAFGGSRARRGRWSWRRRLVYIAGAPLIPLLRAYRMLGDLRRARVGPLFKPGILPALACGLLAATVGEVAGYAFGAGDAPHRRVSFELDRRSYTREADRSDRTQE